MSSITSLPTPATRVSNRIRSVAIKGGFLDGVRLEFDEGLNCFIGGRGTGKTTVIEFIRFAFDALPSADDDSDERRRIESLIRNNLGAGRVEVGFETPNGLAYVASRCWGEDPVVLTSDGESTELRLKSGSVFRADIYSQNEVERIANRAPSQLVLIDRFRSEDISAIDLRLRELEQELKTNANHLLSLESKRDDLFEEVATLPEVDEKLKAFAGTGGEDAKEIDRAHLQKALRDRESRAIDAIDAELLSFQQRLDSLSGLLVQQTSTFVTTEMLEGPNGTMFSDLVQRIATCGRDVDGLLRRIVESIDQARQDLAQTVAALSSTHNKQEMVFRTLIERYEVAMEQAMERANLERVRNELLSKRREAESLASQIDALRRERDSLLERLSELQDRRFSIRQGVASRINDTLSPLIRVRVEQFGDVVPYFQLLAGQLRGVGIQQNAVALKIATTVPPRDLQDLVLRRDSRGLADHSGINSTQAERVVEKLNNRGVLFDLETVQLNDEPKIELRDGDVYKDSETLSTGQKCTSILPILLLDSDRPLLVDQPEDNLDNGFIYETVVTRVREVKNDRQLIFVTHNPNIPVLGDAGRVFVFKSSGRKAWIETEGTVDDCRDEIVTLLEGGERAFKLRQKKYKY